jgi:ferredoxin
MRIVADKSLCVGAGQCVMVAQQLFAQGEEDGLVILKDATPSEAMRALADLAVRSCPSLALKLED